MISQASLTALWLSIKLALISTLLLILIALPLAWWLNNSKWLNKHDKTKALIDAVITLPLVLPPTVLGFYCLIAFAPNAFLGKLWLNLTGSPLAFSFSGLVIASIIYSLPFAVQPLQAGFSQLSPSIIYSARCLGLSSKNIFWKIILPLCKPALITASTLCFAHTLGEFGVVLMIGGNIPGETQLVSIALYDYVESLQYGEAHRLAGVLLLLSLSLLSISYWLNRKSKWRIGSVL